MNNKRGQITIFIVIAIILIASVSLYFIFRNRVGISTVPDNFQPIYNSFLYCLEENTQAGINALESQGGYINLPAFESGSEYMPFSSQLYFMGVSVPYWYYVSGNNVEKEQVPSKNEMEIQLEQFIEEQINDCVFEEYYAQGFQIEKGQPRANVVISGSRVDVSLDMDLTMASEDEVVLVNMHKVSLNSYLGDLYSSAKEVYAAEQEELFLEEYALDTLRLYAPVEGIEITCAPKIWNADDVFDNLETAISDNTLFLKSGNSNYVLTNDSHEYFVLDLDTGEDVRFVNFKNWPHTFQVEPSEESFLIAEPVGNQPELGILGFCYVPYHFVYDLKYPVLVQIHKHGEIFQFPLAVVIQGNQPREALAGSASAVDDVQLCEYKNTPLNVRAVGSTGESVEADIYFECFGETCRIGITPLEENFPQCSNGYVIARAEGYGESRQLFSTTSSGSVEMLMDKIYEKNLNLKIDGINFEGNAIIVFKSDKGSRTVAYPEQRSVELSSGDYEVQVYVYEDVSLNFDSSSYSQCVDVPSSGIAGILGFTEEECFEMELPSQMITSALSAGGKKDYYFAEGNLQISSPIEIIAFSLPKPNTLEQLQENYLLFEDKSLTITS
jgi:hypothetical protein